MKSTVHHHDLLLGQLDPAIEQNTAYYRKVSAFDRTILFDKKKVRFYCIVKGISNEDLRCLFNLLCKRNEYEDHGGRGRRGASIGSIALGNSVTGADRTL